MTDITIRLRARRTIGPENAERDEAALVIEDLRYQIQNLKDEIKDLHTKIFDLVDELDNVKEKCKPYPILHEEIARVLEKRYE